MLHDGLGVHTEMAPLAKILILGLERVNGPAVWRCCSSQYNVGLTCNDACEQAAHKGDGELPISRNRTFKTGIESICPQRESGMWWLIERLESVETEPL